MDDLLHHYTSIENLSLILNSKKIRFNRLDKVDDLKEIEGLPREFSTYTYISCWTDEVEESIPLWKMYTQNMRGVRISLPKDMFKKKKIKAGFYGTTIYEKDVIGPFSSSELITDSYCIVNDFTAKFDFFGKVMYKDNYPDNYESIFRVNEVGGASLNCISMMGLFKKKIWEFQKECRFKLYIFPKLKTTINERDSHSIINALKNNIPNKFDYFDIELDENILDNLTLRLGPLCNNADTIIVDSLLKRYTQNGRYEISELCGTLRK